MSSTTLPDIGRAARWFHALSDETRLEIVRLLSHGERCVCELQDVLDSAQSRLSFHLKTLKDAGLVSDRREGRWVYYALNREIGRASCRERVEMGVGGGALSAEER